MNVFDSFGPVMIGPSNSRTAGAARIGGIARAVDAGKNLTGGAPGSALYRAPAAGMVITSSACVAGARGGCGGGCACVRT